MFARSIDWRRNSNSNSNSNNNNNKHGWTGLHNGQTANQDTSVRLSEVTNDCNSEGAAWRWGSREVEHWAHAWWATTHMCPHAQRRTHTRVTHSGGLVGVSEQYVGRVQDGGVAEGAYVRTYLM